MNINNFIEISNYACPVLPENIIEELINNIKSITEKYNNEKVIDADSAYSLFLNSIKLMNLGYNRTEYSTLEDFILLKSGKKYGDALDDLFPGLKEAAEDSKKFMEYFEKTLQEQGDEIDINDKNGYFILYETFPEDVVGAKEIKYEDLNKFLEDNPQLKENLLIDNESKSIKNTLLNFNETKFGFNNDSKFEINFGKIKSDLLEILARNNNKKIFCVDASILGALKFYQNSLIYYENDFLGTAEDLLPKLTYMYFTKYQKVIGIVAFGGDKYFEVTIT